MRIKKGRKVGVNMWHSEPHKGLSYGSFCGTALEDIYSSGWDVFDIKRDDGEEVPAYGFSIYIGRDGGR